MVNTLMLPETSMIITPAAVALLYSLMSAKMLMSVCQTPYPNRFYNFK